MTFRDVDKSLGVTYSHHTMEPNINEAKPVRKITGFGRIFESMYQGSMVGAGPDVFAVWPYVIAHMRAHAEHGALVELNPKLLAFILGASEAQIEKAINFLCDQDPDSRSKAEDGKRLVRMGQFVYRVVNGAEYMAVRAKEDARFKHAERQKRYRGNQSRKRQIRVENESREARFVEAHKNGDEALADKIAAEGL